MPVAAHIAGYFICLYAGLVRTETYPSLFHHVSMGSLLHAGFKYLIGPVYASAASIGVSGVLGGRAFAEIGKRIVGRISVSMINHHPSARIAADHDVEYGVSRYLERRANPNDVDLNPAVRFVPTPEC
jgi:hypothetical protein